jgi:hypothetical protein
LFDDGQHLDIKEYQEIQNVHSFSPTATICYALQNYRYCHRIGRHHTSNGVYFVVQFSENGFYQKCHDPDCRSYRSPLIPLPHFVVDYSQSIDTIDMELLDAL